MNDDQSESAIADNRDRGWQTLAECFGDRWLSAHNAATSLGIATSRAHSMRMGDGDRLYSPQALAAISSAMHQPALVEVVTIADRTIAERDVAQTQVAELLERIGRATGATISTAPTAESVTEGLRVLDSLSSPTDMDDGWYWGDPIGDDTSGLTGAWLERSGAEQDAAEHSDELTHGYVLVRVEDGLMLAPMYVAPRRGEN